MKRLIVLLCAAMALPAQTITSSLVGRVTDPTGGVIPKASITGTSAETGEHRTTSAGDDGNYLLLQLAPGRYTVEVTAAGFKKYVATGIVLELQEKATFTTA